MNIEPNRLKINGHLTSHFSISIISLQVPNYRTTLCQAWSSKGTCMYGDTCMYAHGSHQLRNRFVTGGASGGGSGHFISGSGGSSGHFDFGASGMPDCKRVRI